MPFPIPTTSASASRGPRSHDETSALEHRELRGDAFWHVIPAFAGLTEAEFHDHRFQAEQSITTIAQLRSLVEAIAPPEFLDDVERGLEHTTMSMRVTPYILGLIDWNDPYRDPLRIQFVPVASAVKPDHPMARLDALNERNDSPVSGLTHRYPDRVLFLALETCPVYCRVCTRSYAIGLDTQDVEKFRLGARMARWNEAIRYIASNPAVEDVVVSGGDVGNLKPAHIESLGMRLLDISHVRRIRFASKTPAIMPQKLVTDHAWVDALTRVVDRGRSRHQAVSLHTHFNHAREITEISRIGLGRLMERGITVRNQAVLQRGVNDTDEEMHLLVRRLGFVNVRPYYVYVHDMVPGVEDLRTSLAAALDLEKSLRGVTAGFHTPTFVVDTLGGGGKRDAHSFEYYDRENGIAVFTSPSLNGDRPFFHFDPVHMLGDAARRRWHDPDARVSMIEAATESSRG